jgi:hypothetical protein
MRAPVAAICLPEGRDILMHASMSCTKGGIRIRPVGRYIVTTAQKAIEARKKPCPECWTLHGYLAADDIVAAQ